MAVNMSCCRKRRSLRRRAEAAHQFRSAYRSMISCNGDDRRDSLQSGTHPRLADEYSHEQRPGCEASSWSGPNVCEQPPKGFYEPQTILMPGFDLVAVKMHQLIVPLGRTGEWKTTRVSLEWRVRPRQGGWYSNHVASSLDKHRASCHLAFKATRRQRAA